MSKKHSIKSFGLLTPIQKTFLGVFSQLPDQAHFYLTDGTALAEYYLGHRFSYDLDFFLRGLKIWYYLPPTKSKPSSRKRNLIFKWCGGFLPLHSSCLKKTVKA